MSGKSIRLTLLMLLGTGLVILPARLPAQQASTPDSAADSLLEGKRVFSTTCAACHGLDGRGGERGPDIATKREVQLLADQDVFRIVQDGIAGTGMPSFSSLGRAQIQGVVRYLRTLEGEGPMEKLPGDPERGKAVFFGQGGCSQCHTAKGEGGFIASDLSRYAGIQSAQEIRNAIIDPNRNLDQRCRGVTVTTADGKTRTGITRNEDNFSLQMQTFDGSFHLFKKSELRRVEYQPRSLMPADYGSKLSQGELDDVVSYLMSLGRERQSK